jgi:predicted amidohydrolase YtcJ
MIKNWKAILISVVLLCAGVCLGSLPVPDMVFVNGKIITVDKSFTIAEAVAVFQDRILAVGSNSEIEKLSNSKTTWIDLKGKTVIPGLIDAHLHPESASCSELFEEIPDVSTLSELFEWISAQTVRNKPGEWIVHPKFFPTRLLEMRQPTLAELDAVAPDHPVFLNGSYGGNINSAAMVFSGIDSNTNHPGLQKDPNSDKLTGFIQGSAFRLLKVTSSPPISYADQLNALEAMISRYNRVGLTSLGSGIGNIQNIKMYLDLKKQGRLTARIFQNMSFPVKIGASYGKIISELKQAGYYTGFGDEWIRVGALKVILDGGILTGTAYLRQSWGEKAGGIFGISDPAYRGILNITREDLFPIVKAATEMGWKFTAHCTGGGGVDILLDVFEEVNNIYPIKDSRFSIIHGNFYTSEAIVKMKKLGIFADMQPAWFYKDADAMKYILGEERIKTFHPYKSLLDTGVMVNGGSDHMVKFDPNAAINPYNPFLGMWTMISRKTQWDSVIIPEEAISRQEALKIYTINNAYASFEEDIKGSIEPGKLADMVVISKDILTCPVDSIKTIKAEMTLLGGKVVYLENAFKENIRVKESVKN